MSPVIAYHATRRACRLSILENGLLPAQPTMIQPFGVYVFDIWDEWNHPTIHRVHWDSSRKSDLWQVAYIGPITYDRLVVNGLCLTERVEHATLV